MKDTIEIYVQPGIHGQHAGGRSPCQTWAAHETDEATAAWRCALKHWFPRRPNGVLLYTEARAITIEKIGQHEFRANLEMPDKPDGKTKLRQPITPELLSTPSKPTRRVAKRRGAKARK